MNPVVTARVPEGVRARGVDVEYVIKERELPKPRVRQEDALQPHKISPEQLAQAASFMESVKVSVPAEWEDAPFEDLLDSAMEERYAHLR